jgi:hypothetical protein
LLTRGWSKCREISSPFLSRDRKCLHSRILAVSGRILSVVYVLPNVYGPSNGLFEKANFRESGRDPTVRERLHLRLRLPHTIGSCGARPLKFNRRMWKTVRLVVWEGAIPVTRPDQPMMCLARAKTARNIFGVNLPVCVFC